MLDLFGKNHIRRRRRRRRRRRLGFIKTNSLTHSSLLNLVKSRSWIILTSSAGQSNKFLSIFKLFKKINHGVEKLTKHLYYLIQ